MMRKVFFIWILCTLSISAAPFEVASLHPLITDLVKQVGGEKVKIVEIGKPGMDARKFQPRSSDIRAMARCRLIFASGKGLELYLKDLQDSLSKEQKIVEVGRTLPSQRVTAKDEVYACCPHHSRGSVDPHWWHNVKNMERAVSVIVKELAHADRKNEQHYKLRGKIAARELQRLHGWVKAQVAQIPKKQRHLVTAHAAFGYFCKAYGFKASFVEGLSREGEISSKQLAETIRTLHKKQIRAVFPESQANSKVLRQIATESGAKLAKPLVADGAVKSYKKMVYSNVGNIVAALKP